MKIQELLKQAKPCWKYAAYDEDGEICFYSAKPKICKDVWGCSNAEGDFIYMTSDVFEIIDIEPFEGDWKDSLIEREE